MLTEYGLPTTSASGFRQRRRKPSVVCFWSREPEDNVPACHHSGSGRMTSNPKIIFRFLDRLSSARHYCDSKIVNSNCCGFPLSRWRHNSFWLRRVDLFPQSLTDSSEPADSTMVRNVKKGEEGDFFIQFSFSFSFRCSEGVRAVSTLARKGLLHMTRSQPASRASSPPRA